MDARFVWNTWRRILTSDTLVAQTLGQGQQEPSRDQLSSSEAAVIAEYARTNLATSTNIGMYRNGLSRNALAALALVPMSRHLLFQSGLDVDGLADAFVTSTMYRDEGPNFWRIAGDFVDYIAKRPAFSRATFQDILALDAATIALARRLGIKTPLRWPAAAAGKSAAIVHGESTAIWAATSAAVVVASSHDITPWLVAPDDFDPTEPLEFAQRHWLVYIASSEAAPSYAELSARAARLFQALLVPMSAASAAAALEDLSEIEVREALNGLVELGVVVATSPAGESHRRHSANDLPDDAFVLLDPAVEVLDSQLGGYRFMVHDRLDLGMAIPPGDGLLDFIVSLTGRPAEVGALRRAYDDATLVDRMLTNLLEYGFIYRTGSDLPSPERLHTLRIYHEVSRQYDLRSIIDIDLDAGASIDDICEAVGTKQVSPDLALKCRRVADHGVLLTELARHRQSGTLSLHHTVLQSADLAGSAGVCSSIIRLGATVVLENGIWPFPKIPYAGLDEMTRRGVEIQVAMVPDHSILDAEVRERAINWATSAFVTGFRLEIKPEAIWGTERVLDADFLALFAAVGGLEDAVGDVEIINLPGDDVLLGKTASSHRNHGTGNIADRLRRAYVRWRLPILKLVEGDNTWSQTPEAEAKVVVPSTDLLPNNPDLLGLAPGAILVDVCGGLGRVARRMAPSVGSDGLVISFEMLRCLTQRARHVACAKGITNVSFRTGLAQRLPLPDGVADAAINEWTAGIWELGLGPTMLCEMRRIIRPGGRIAVTHRLVRIPLTQLDHPWVQIPEIHRLMLDSFEGAGFRNIEERIWGQVSPSLVGEYAADWRKQYVPRLASPFDVIYDTETNPGPHADVYLTIVAERP